MDFLLNILSGGATKRNRKELEGILDGIGPIGRVMVIDPDIFIRDGLYRPLSRIARLKTTESTQTAYTNLSKAKYDLIILDALAYHYKSRGEQVPPLPYDAPEDPEEFEAFFDKGLNLTECGGVELAHEIKTTDNPNKDTPILLVTVVSEEHLATYLGRRGYNRDELFAGYLNQKSLLPSGLAKKVGEIMKPSQSPQD